MARKTKDIFLEGILNECKKGNRFKKFQSKIKIPDILKGHSTWLKLLLCVPTALALGATLKKGLVYGFDIYSDVQVIQF